jgi:cysteine sulfinate desulfinase/cysteine desulfurase-like protein
VRFSLSRETTDAEITRVLDLLPAVVEDVRAASARAGVALAGAAGVHP